MIDPLFGTAIEIGLALLLLSAAWHKVAGSVSPRATHPVKSCTLAFKANLL